MFQCISTYAYQFLVSSIFLIVFLCFLAVILIAEFERLGQDMLCVLDLIFWVICLRLLALRRSCSSVLIGVDVIRCLRLCGVRSFVEEAALGCQVLKLWSEFFLRLLRHWRLGSSLIFYHLSVSSSLPRAELLHAVFFARWISVHACLVLLYICFWERGLP